MTQLKACADEGLVHGEQKSLIVKRCLSITCHVFNTQRVCHHLLCYEGRYFFLISFLGVSYKLLFFLILYQNDGKRQPSPVDTKLVMLH